MARLVRTGDEGVIPRKNFLAGAAITLAAAGCGGGAFTTDSNPGTSGRLAIEIIWPERGPTTRVIPLAAASMVFTIYPQEEPWTGKVLTGITNRPANGKSVLVLNELPECKLRVEVLAYPGPDGTGAPLGIATQMVTLTVQNPKMTVNFKMSSTVASIEIQENLTQIEVIQSLTTQIVPSAFNASGELLLLFPPPQNWKFIIGNPSLASIDSSGKIKGLKDGTTTLTVQAVEPNGAGEPVVVKQRVYSLKIISSRVAILGTPKPNPDGSQDAPGLYWQSLTSDARQLLVRTTGDHYVVHINPEQTKLLFIARVVHADRTDTQPHAYVINVDGSGLTHILKEADSWVKFSTACYFKSGVIAATGSPDGSNALSGVYTCSDDGGSLQLLHQMDDAGWMASTPSGDDGYVYGTADWLYGVVDGIRKYARFTTWWLADEQHVWRPAQGETYYNSRQDRRIPVVVQGMYDPIILGVDLWISLCEPIRRVATDVVVYGHRAFWEYEFDSIKTISLVCETSEVRGRQSPRFSVTRNGRYIGLMDMQSPTLGLTNPDVLYLLDREAYDATATDAAKNWLRIENFAIANIAQKIK
jgi:hypothetical protein